jgi:putative transposase
VLNAYVFASVTEVQRLTDEWLRDYNEQRPHDALGRVPPATFLARPPSPPESSNVVST